jgi:hypothetical protein
MMDDGERLLNVCSSLLARCKMGLLVSSFWGEEELCRPQMGFALLFGNTIIETFLYIYCFFQKYFSFFGVAPNPNPNLVQAGALSRE